MTKKKEIEDLFTIFHDGVIEDGSISGKNVLLKIGIQYIAELINPSFTFLNFELLGIKHLNYEPWSNEIETILDWNKIISLKLRIHSAEIDNNGKIIVHTECLNAPNKEFEGGKLIIDCKDYNLVDEENNRLTIKELKHLSSIYWNECFGKN